MPSRATASRSGSTPRPSTCACEDGQKLVDLVSDDYQSTVTVDAILTGTGRVPNVEGMDLEAAGVDYDDHDRHPGRRFPADQQSAHLRRRRRLPGAQVHAHRRRFGAHRGAERAVPRPPAAERTDDPVVHLHRSGDRPRRPLRPGGARAGHPGEDLHHPDARRRSRDRRRRGSGLREDPRQGEDATGFSARRSSPATRAR